MDLTPNPEHCYRAMQTRDARFDGQFFTGVLTTGIYCRPICPANPPKLTNCRFFPSSAAAQEAGFRPCLRCRPEVSPGLPAWIGTSATVTRALRLIEDGGVESATSLAAKLGVGDRHLRRLFVGHLGATPVAILTNRRILFAKKLLTETSLPVTDVAFAAGFQSVRRFNAAMSEVYGRPPSKLRGTAAASRGRAMFLKLGYREPYDFPAMLGFLAPRAIPGVETIADGVYRRTIRIGGETGSVSIRDLPASHCLEARIDFSGPRHLQAIVDRIRRLFDLRANAFEIARHFDTADPALGYRASTRVPGCWDPFELFVRAILGQQITVAGATTLAGRIVAAYADPLSDGGLLFPTPSRLADASYDGIGLTGKRIATLKGLAAAFADNELDLTQGLDNTVRSLCELEGIGPWTAHYVAMRAANEPDAFPASDLGLRKSAGGLTQTALEARAEAWRPWRAYAAMHLWSTYPK